MRDSSDTENGYVECANCGTECGLTHIPQLASDCSTLEATQAGSVVEVQPAPSNNNALELPCDWTQENSEKNAA